jgi:thymidylate synthase
MNVSDIRNHFINELKNENFVVDRNGGKTIELLGASFEADESAIFGTVNREYVKAEIDWYRKMSTNINDIYTNGREPPAAWKMTANDKGEVNSNYGYLVFSMDNYDQFNNVIEELDRNPYSRRASMIYTRPSIWNDYNENGKNDFICTNAVTYYIRNRQVHCVVQMRSNDVVYGYKNDRAWQKYLLNLVAYNLNIKNPTATETFNQSEILTAGKIYWQVQNLHVYEKHFDLVK